MRKAWKWRSRTNLQTTEESDVHFTCPHVESPSCTARDICPSKTPNPAPSSVAVAPPCDGNGPP